VADLQLAAARYGDLCCCKAQQAHTGLAGAAAGTGAPSGAAVDAAPEGGLAVHCTWQVLLGSWVLRLKVKPEPTSRMGSIVCRGVVNSI
jgi:hypothetical protein